MMHRGLLLLALLASSLIATHTLAAETDNFHGRDPARVADSLRPLDAFVNTALDEALARANEKPGCPADGIHKAIKEKLGAMPFGQAENFADEDKSVARVVVPKGQNIYTKKGTLWDSLAVPSCSPMIRLSGKWTGTDKLGHFFSEGFDYYVRGKGSALDAYRYGSNTEKGLFGSETTGVRSYADLAANASGFSFYNEVLGGQSPYFECRGGRFTRTSRRFSWKDYISEAWDEAINCSKFTPEMEALVLANLSDQKLSCPVDPEACRRIGKLQDARYFVNPDCVKLSKLSSVPLTAPAPGQPASCPGVPQPCEFRKVRKQMRELAAPLSSVPASRAR